MGFFSVHQRSVIYKQYIMVSNAFLAIGQQSLFVRILCHLKQLLNFRVWRWFFSFVNQTD